MAGTRKKSPSPAKVRAPLEIEAVSRALEFIDDAVVITRDAWESAGVEILWANRAFAKLTGYPAGRMTGKNTRVLHGPKTELALRTSPGWAESGEGWLHRRDGEAFYASWNFSPIGARDAAGGFLIGFYRDRSEMHQVEEALLHSQKLDAIGRLAGSVAHDLNNLLSIINGYCEITTTKLASQPTAQKDLVEVHQAGLKAAAITRQVLDFSRRQDTEACVVNANTLIREIAGMIGRLMGERGKVELRLASDLGNMRIDPTQFQQMLLNLCFNARDAMPDGGKLTVRTFRQDRDATDELLSGGWVVVQVTDTGAGMTAAVRKRIFEPFFTTKRRGTGLGLSTVMGIVKRAGGQISVQSAVRSGTTFEMRFQETAEPEQSIGGATATVPPPSEGIWLVESDLLQRKMMSGILAIDGYRLNEFSSPTEVFDQDPAGRPALLVIDGAAPRAIELVRWLLTRNRELRVLALAGEMPPAVVKDLPARSVGHLPKPFALRALLREVRGLLDGDR
ncbi:MAG TPA: ATP-binding protein [Candidatus Didemnitutus sp.]|nr:ATP-binding protein [Candidatus Didemnitutus sp.]